MYQCVKKRFWINVIQRSETECWDWCNCKDREGRPKFALGGKSINASRVMYQIMVGPIPEGMLVCHHCDNPGCMNWHHFFLGTNQDNVREKMSKNRQSRGENHGRSKLTEKEVLAIITLLKEGTGAKSEIAKIFNISIGAIDCINKYQSWRHILRDKVIRKDGLSSAQRLSLIDLVTNSNKTKKEIADILGIGIYRLNNLIKKFCITSKKQQQEKQILELLQSNKTYKEISEIIGTSIDVIGRIAHKTGIYRKKRLDRETIEKVLELLREGRTYKDIIETLNVTSSNISSIVSGKFYKELTAGRKLTAGKKLTELGVLQIRLWVKEGKKQKEISEIMGISIDTISNIVRGKSWKHVL